MAGLQRDGAHAGHVYRSAANCVEEMAARIAELEAKVETARIEYRKLLRNGDAA